MIESHDVIITPRPSQQRSFQDYFGNPTIHMTVEEDHQILSVEATSVITVDRDHSALLAENQIAWEQVRDAMAKAKYGTEAEFTCASPFTQPTHELAAYGAESYTEGRPILEATMDLTRRIYEDFEYDGTVTDVSTPVDQVFEIRGGVCQDFAHLQLTCLRALGLPARYVSGYLRTYPPAGKPRLIGADASHAWISVWCPEAGWVDFDPTNNKMIADEHITLTVGRDFGDVSPISGIILGGGNHYIDVSVDVMPIDLDGNEIGTSVTSEELAKVSSEVSGASKQEVDQSQRANPERQQEQSQEQVQAQDLTNAHQAPVTNNAQPDSLPPLSIDRTY